MYYKLNSGVVHTIGVEICLNGGCIEEGIVGKWGFWLLIAYGINLRSLNTEISMGMGLSLIKNYLSVFE